MLSPAAFPVSLPGHFACWDGALHHPPTPEDCNFRAGGGGVCLEQAQSYSFSNRQVPAVCLMQSNVQQMVVWKTGAQGTPAPFWVTSNLTGRVARMMEGSQGVSGATICYFRT